MRLSGLIVLLIVIISRSNIGEEVQDDDYYDYYDEEVQDDDYYDYYAEEVQDDDYYDYYDYESTVDSDASTDCKTVG